MAVALTGCGGDAPTPPPATFNISVTVSGLDGTGLVLLQGSEELAINADGDFTFPTDVISGGSFDVRVLRHPVTPNQYCRITNGTGSVTAESGRHLLAGLELAVCEVNDAGGVAGRPLELVVRDTAADPQKAVAAVDELAGQGVAALVGEYHSVIARAVAARADALGLPFLCSSAVLDALTEQPTKWVARLAPAQSHGWRICADFLFSAGHKRIALATQSNVYWASGTRILRDYLAPCGDALIELDMHALAPASVCDELVNNGATALLLLIGQLELAISVVKSVRHNPRCTEILIGAPAGQPELTEWAALLGENGTAISFLRYLPERLGPLGARVETALRERLGQTPSFVAFEGYDTIAFLAEVLRSHGTDRARKRAAQVDNRARH